MRMDLKHVNQIFKETKVKRNGHFSTIGFLNRSDVSDMLLFIRDEKY